ncbi:ABC transporter ATP-binding protein [Streptomyces sp. SP18CS02]|uniref:ABC transporter ATP-binding protein n=1 Tax=Streptomyces sp. SP18CS02 TaxID=3002531 RepID=UPI002E76D29C|nr:ABC transporter ATP-binding protein [Streptomyces sp. SP18CS02]MEE1752711.1 ABC transporter ATP-binding protein [Streptomyces sp. SP18CS02]
MTRGAVTAAPSAAVEIKDLVVRRGTTSVLGGLTARIEQGDAVRLAGPNGCGKSTLLSVLAGLTQPFSGMVVVGGRPPGDRTVRALRGFLQEPPPLYDHLTVREQVSLVGGLWGVRTGPLMDRLAALGVGSGQQHVLVGELSLGQRKKTGFVCATAHDPRLLLLDEPFNGLDASAVSTVHNDLLRRKRDGVTIVCVSHTALDDGLLDRTIDLSTGGAR